MDRDIQALIARLLAHRALPREDPLARRALTDEAFRQELDLRLSNCGLELLDNPYASHVAAGIKRELEEAVFGAEEQWPLAAFLDQLPAPRADASGAGIAAARRSRPPL